MQWVGPDTDQLLTARSDHLRSPTAPSAHRGAPGSSSRPKRLVTAREDRGEYGVPTVGAAQVVELVDLRVGDVPSSRPIGGGSCWSCRGGWCCARTAVYLGGPTAAPLSMGAWRPHGDRRSPSGRPGCGFTPLHRAEQWYTAAPAISAAHLAKKEAFQRGRCDPPTPPAREPCMCSPA